MEGVPVQRLSIIVPLMGDLKRFEDTLVSVLENQPERSEVVVVLNEPYDDPYELRGEVKFVEAPPGADLVDCFACGLAASNAPVVHMIASGFEATPGWADAALARFAEAGRGRGGPRGGRSRPSRADPLCRAPLDGGRLDRPHRRRKASGSVCRQRPRLLRPGTGGCLLSPGRAGNGRDLAAPRQRTGSRNGSGLGHAQGRISLGSGAGLRDDRHGRIARLPAAAPGGKALPASGFSVAGRRFPVGSALGPHMPGWWPWSACSFRCGPRSWRASPAASGPRWASARRARVAIGPQVAASQKEAVIRPHHFGAADARPALAIAGRRVGVFGRSERIEATPTFVGRTSPSKYGESNSQQY